MRLDVFVSCLLVSAFTVCSGEENSKQRLETTTIGTEDQQFYYWKSAGVGQSAQLLTVFCRGCGAAADSDLPVISIMRDTLGDASRDNDRVTSIWLLTFSTPSFGQ